MASTRRGIPCGGHTNSRADVTPTTAINATRDRTSALRGRRLRAVGRARLSALVRFNEESIRERAAGTGRATAPWRSERLGSSRKLARRAPVAQRTGADVIDGR